MAEKEAAETAPACHDGLTEARPDPLGAWRDEVRGREYAKALVDGRVLMWRPIATCPTNRPYIIGAFDPEVEGRWLMEIKQPNTNNVIWMSDPAMPKCSHGVVATHWREDTVGTPYTVPASGREQPYCAPGLHRLP